MSIKMNSAAVSISNKMVYVPRIEERHTESDVMRIIDNARVGRVAYVDFVAVKDNAPEKEKDKEKNTKFYSAFIMMREWNPNALADLTERGQVRVWIDSNRSAYFMLLPAKEGSEIPRSKVNIHQLASYTAELYTRIDASDQKVIEQSNLIASQATLIETQSKQMEEMRQRMEEMNEQMKALAMSVSYMDTFLISRFAQANRPVQPEEEEGMIEIVIE